MISSRWWFFLLRGLLALLFGIAAFIWPELALDVLVILFGAYVFVDGLLTIVAVIIDRAFYPRWGRTLLAGLLGVAVGGMAFVWPNITQLALLLLIAAWSLLMGILLIAAAIEVRKAVQGEWLLGLIGILSILFALLLVLWPERALIALIWIIGGYALLLGVLYSILAFRVRNWRTHLGSL